MTLPPFNYHPDPITTGSISASEALCRCCEKRRGYIYTSSVYAVDELNSEICPWCIADGSAAQKFGASFVFHRTLVQAGIEQAIILEVTTKTPGYDSWQQEVWLTHCNDACAFLGDAPISEVLKIASEHIPVYGAEGFDDEIMQAIAKHYRPKGSPAFYKFKCLHCKAILYAMDFD